LWRVSRNTLSADNCSASRFNLADVKSTVKGGNMTEKELQNFVRDYVKAINSHDNKQIEDYHAPNSVVISAGDPGKTMDRTARRRYFEEREKAFPDAKMTVRNVRADAKAGTVTFDWTIRGTHKGAFKGMPATNKQVTNRGTSELKIKNGKIAQETSHQDVAAFRKQVAAS
jgi:steroid delta-isomerase-like uncharacterized protein